MNSNDKRTTITNGKQIQTDNNDRQTTMKKNTVTNEQQWQTNNNYKRKTNTNGQQ